MTQIRKQVRLTPREAGAKPGRLDELLDPAVFKALGDPTRVRLLACMAKCGRGCSVTEVAACCSVDFSVVSRHLGLLERAGVVRSTREGRTVRYIVCYPALAARLRALADELDACGPGCGCAPGGCCDGG